MIRERVEASIQRPGPGAGPRARLLRALMRLGATEPRPDDLSLGEIFQHPRFAGAGAEERRTWLVAAARFRRADEEAHPFDRYFGQDLSPWLAGQRVLDLGCFVGGRSLAWLDRYRLAGLVGADVDPTILAGGAAYAAEKGQAADFVGAVGERLPFRAGSFDAVLSFDVFEHVQAPAQVLAECHRILRPGGRLYAVFPSYWHPTEHHLGLVTRTPCLHWFFSGAELVQAYDAAIRARGAAAAWYRRRSPELAPWEQGHTLNGTTSERFRELAVAAGFTPIAMPILPLFQTGRLIERRPILRLLRPLFALAARLPGIGELMRHRVVAILERPVLTR
jgi:SAM-dependent methyltransferase